MKPLLLVIGLGLAGIDPLGLSVLVAALAAGARKPQVIAFCLATVAGAVAVGVAVSLFGKGIAGQLTALIPGFDDPDWAIVELIVAGMIVAWLISQLRKPSNPKTPTETAPAPKVSTTGMALSGLAFGGATTLDPTFFATAAIASQVEGLIAVGGLHVIWVLTSQCLMFGFALAYLFDAHQPLANAAKPIWEKIKGPAMKVLMIGLAIAAAVLTADAVTLFLTGEYLIQL